MTATPVRLSLPLLVFACVCVSAQDAAPNPSAAAEAKQGLTRVMNNLVKAAEKVPEEDYSFRATPEVRPFGQLIAHVADSQMRACSMLNGSPKTPSAGSKTSKADLVAALQDSVAECDKAAASVTEANASEFLGSGYMHHSRLGMLYYITAHDNEMYGTMCVYMRLKNIVPPSSEPRK